MKLHFESDLDYQRQAIEAVCDLFKGQEICRTEFTVERQTRGLDKELPEFASELGVGNRLTLLDDELLANLRDIQAQHGLPRDESLDSGDFTVEMETGTGKTYVYLRTIFELNKRFGFTKFVIVVPSVAIKEGVAKSLDIMGAHFRGLYANTPFAHFVYDSRKLGQVRDFATSPQIRIMVVTVGAINKKDVNTIYENTEKVGGEKPIDLIKATRPVIIVDEPQSVDGGLEGRGKAALDAMNPLCTLRYSATHKQTHHQVFRLDAVDAYERKLVKQIEVASATVESAHNKPYVKLVAVKSTKAKGIYATVELDVAGTAGGIQRVTREVMDGDDLRQTTERDLYEHHSIGELRATKGAEHLELKYPGGEVFLKPGESFGGVDARLIATQMIRRTIKEHLDKELRLNPQGIKVLSLFFIDAVDKYRRYDAEGNPVKGEYAEIFEAEYARLAKHPDYNTLFKEVDITTAAQEVHNGYFSIDRKKVGSKTVEQFKDTSGTTKADDDTYGLIMRDKERLLDLATPLRFIFSHSALREGWDNPNVFQICSLRDMSSEQQRRQTIGRGLRLAVNKEGNRVRGFEVNTLTVIATESYEEFAANLQKEIENDTGYRFGTVEENQLAGLTGLNAQGESITLTKADSKAIRDHLRAAGYLDAKGKVQDTLRAAIKSGTVSLPAQGEPLRPAIVESLRKLCGRLEIKNADEKKYVPARRAVLDSEEFKQLWLRIRHKTTYRVAFDNEKLLSDCADAIRKGPPISRARLQWRKADIAIGKSGLSTDNERTSATVTLKEDDILLPDILGTLQDRTHLTRRSIVSILTDSGRLDDFKANPQEFIDLAADLINRTKRLAIVDGIKYQKLGDKDFYAQELFETEELKGYLNNMVASSRGLYEQVICDSATEKDFAAELDGNESVKVYAKLPGWFKVPTPLGSYNPDWAVLIDTDEGERLYFVVETKSSLFDDDLRDRESAKIECGKAHFKALGEGVANPARYEVARTLEDVLSRAAQ